MPKMPCPRKVVCEPEGPLINYSSETEDFLTFTGIVYTENPPPINEPWTANGCIGLCTSTISQEDADLCAQRQAVLCVNDNDGQNELFQNTEQSCQASCPDGTVFTFVVPAGMFIGPSQAEADAQAYAYACQQAELQKICLGPMQKCFCEGDPIPDQTIVATGPTRPLTFMVTSGSLPPGLTIDSSVRSDMQTVISGTPTTAGNYTFAVTAMDAQGNFSVKPYSFSVLVVSTAALPDFTVGTPYSFQMTASGGSGHYNWRIVSGSLPTGLTMTLGGLISGTPTGGSSTVLRFEVIDTECEQADKDFFPPQVRLETLSTTRVATVRGYPEFITPSFPPKKYHKLTWDGNTYQWGHVLSTGEACGFARFNWVGTSEIDGSGNHLSFYQKNFYASCPDAGSPGHWPQFLSNGNNSVNVGTSKFIGYCWALDPNSCPDCILPPDFIGDQSGDYTNDTSPFMHGQNTTFVDKTHYQVHRVGNQPSLNWKGEWDNGTNYTIGDNVSRNHFYYLALKASGPVTPDNAKDPELFPDFWQLQYDFQFPGSIEPDVNFPQSEFNGVPHWIMLRSSHWYDGLLEDEYTDAEALANAVVYNNVGNTAETTPRTFGYVSRYTSVAFSLVCSNLIVGESYTVRVKIYNTRTGVTTFKTYNLLAGADTETIHDNVPTPLAGQPLQVKDPGIVFA